MIYFTFLPDYKNHRNISGNAVMNQQMYLRYFDKKKDILLNATAKKDLLTITKKIYFVFLSLILVIFGKQKEIYTVLFDYKGFYFQVLFLFFISFFCKKIIIHHHSFKYLNDKKILILLKSKKIIHICSSKKQYSSLKKNYFFRNIHLIENYIFLYDEKIWNRKKEIRKFKIIYYSRIHQNKGIFDFIRLATEMVGNKKVSFKIFGNECSNETKVILKNLKNKNIIEDFKLNINKFNSKKMFLNNDILIFPSKHKSETTPLVIDECINYGVIPIAYNIGDIKRQISNLNLIANTYNEIKQKLINTINNYKEINPSIIKIKKVKLTNKHNSFKKLDKIFQ